MKKAVLLSLIISIFAGCSKEDFEKEIMFKVELSKVEDYSATLIVTHNATNDDAYYGIIVKGDNPNINEEINKFILNTDDSQLGKYIHYQCKSKFTVGDLLPNTTYSFIVFGMNEKGIIYGRPSSVTFKTLRSNLIASINPNWEIIYNGHKVHNDTDYSLISVHVSGDIQERYFLVTYPVETVQSYESIEDLIAISTNEMLDYLNSQSDTINWFESDRIRTRSTNFYQHLTEGDYISFIIGLDEYCKPTGHYAKSGIYHVEKYPLVLAYANLLGEWYLTDKTQKTYYVTFSEHIPNKYLIMTNWGNLSESNVPIIVSFNRNDGSIAITNQLIYDDFKQTFTDGTTVEGKLIIRGMYINKNGYIKTVNNNPVSGYMETVNSYIFPGFSLVSEDNSTKFDTGMALYIDSKERSIWYAKMLFPYTMEKVNSK